MRLLRRLRRLAMTTPRLDALLVSDEHNVSYLSGTQGIEARLLINFKRQAKNLFITDLRYTYQAQDCLKGFKLEVIGRRQSYFKGLAQALDRPGLKRIGFEAKALSFAEVEQLKKKLPKRACLVPTYNIVEGLRVKKEQGELKLIRQAADITRDAFKYIKRFLKPGVRERDIADRILSYMRGEGADGEAFPIIVASGKRTAWPHAPVSGRKLSRNDIVVIDAGARFKGYNSDLTRTFFLGRINPTLKQCFDAVKQAKNKAIRAVKPGLKISELDRIARAHIAGCGFGKQFLHNLGHGVGLSVHEAPVVSRRSDEILKPGMVLTIEPGIYLEGLGGIRLEDMVLVTKTGYKAL